VARESMKHAARRPRRHAKARFGFLLDERLEIETELAHGFLGFFVDPEIDEIVGEVRTGKELSREVADDTDVLCTVIETV